MKLLNTKYRSSYARQALTAACEPLESRRLLSGSWAALTHAAPGGVETALQLTDGSIMVNGEGGGGAAQSAWYKLTPVNGSYANGTWTTLASMHSTRRFFGSSVLPNGNVFVLGGEYSSAGGETNTGEIYNTLANTWTNIPAYPGGSDFGDGDTIVLSDGRVLCSGAYSTSAYIYNPATNTWSAGIAKVNGDANSEETWLKLADGSILSYEISGSKPQTAQRFILGATDAQDQWIAAGSVPVALATNGGNSGIVPEEGPAFLLPNGHAFFVGATSNTAIYTPPTTLTGTGSWATGPTIPNSLGALDAPGCVLPNGNVLFNAGVINANTFPAPTTMFEVNPEAYESNPGGNPIVATTAYNGNLNGQEFETRMLVLPTGQMLLSNASSTMYIWTESNNVSAFTAPTISDIHNDSGSNTFTLSGYGLNGASEGGSYGDDAQDATDYPLVRLTDQYGNITYARTFNWTSNTINNTYSSVSFTEPSVGIYLVSVIANGVASSPVLNVQCSASTSENYAVQVDSFNSAYVAVNQGEGGTTSAYFLVSSFSSLIMTGDAASNTLVIDDNLAGRPTIINGGDAMDYLRVQNNGTGIVTENGGNGNDYFDFDFYGSNLSTTTNFTYVYGDAGTDSIFVYDNANTTATTYTVDELEVNRSGFGGFYYGADIEGIALNTGTAADTVNVPSTYYLTPISLNSAGGDDIVNIGSGGSLASIGASVTVSDTPAFSTINLDNSADTAAEGGITVGASGTTGTISGFAPVPIYWTTTDINAINIHGGSGGNTYSVSTAGIPFGYVTSINAGAGTNNVYFESGIAGVFSVNGDNTSNVGVYDNATTAQTWNLNSSDVARSGFTLNYTSISTFTLDTGTANDLVDIESLPCNTNVYSSGGYDTYNVSTGSKNLGNLGYSTLNINAGPGSSGILNVDNSSYAYISYTTISSTYLSEGNALIDYAGISTLTYNLPAYSNVVYVISTYQTTSYIINGGIGSDELDVGAGDLSSVLDFYPFVGGGITFNPGGGSGTDELLLDDSNSGVGRTYTLTAGLISNGGALSVAYTNAGTLASIVIDGSSGNNVFNAYGVLGTFTQTSLVGGAGNDSFIVGPAGGTLNNFSAGDIVVNGGGGANTLVINDLVNANFEAYNSIEPYIDQEGTGTGYTIARLVEYFNLNSIALNIGAGGSGYSFNVYNTVAGTPITVNNGSGTDTINVYQTSPTGPVIIAPSAGNDPVNVDTQPNSGTALAEFAASQQIGALTIGNGGTARVLTGPKILLQISSIATTGNGVLDLTTNDLIVHSSTLSAVNALVAMGFNSGSAGNWAGPGIASSAAAANTSHLTALGTIQNNQNGNSIFNSSNLFDGVAPAPTDILVKYTYYGDSDLNGKVDGSDYSRIDSAYLTHATGWFNGDFNYDGGVNGTDYALIDNAYNSQGASLASLIAPSPTAPVAAIAIANVPRVTSNAVADSQIAKPTVAAAVKNTVSRGWSTSSVFSTGKPITFDSTSASGIEGQMDKKDILDGLLLV